LILAEPQYRQFLISFIQNTLFLKFISSRKQKAAPQNKGRQNFRGSTLFAPNFHAIFMQFDASLAAL
jgi:hypothetical protein